MMKKLTILIMTIICVTGCVSTPSAVDNHDKTARIDPSVSDSYKSGDSQLSEYVSRVGKRMLMVSSRPGSNYHFEVTESSEPILQLDPESHKIIVSTAVLQQLRDEAELAAVLGLGVAKLNHSANIDRETATTMSYAGYDPNALLDLQQQYFYAANNQQYHWLRVIYPVPISAGTIAANKVMVQKMSKGLLRGAEDYQKEING